MYTSTVEGRGGIVARVVADSISESGKRITTFELEYHRFIHSELMTHRMFSRNAMSSRAVPIEKMIEQVRERPAMPIHWGANQAGMQAAQELSGMCLDMAKQEWINASRDAIASAEWLNGVAKAHKQIVNRLLEPFQMMKTVLTATEFDNFFHLRRHKDAQPEIQELANCMYEAMRASDPELLKDGEWHTPYVNHAKRSGITVYYIETDLGIKWLNADEALKVSASCCAQVSYRLLDNSIDKALKIYDRLVESKPIHASPFEHQAMPIDKYNQYTQGCIDWEKGVTHQDYNNDFWSGNLKGWIQHRQLINNHTVWSDE